MNLLNIFYTLAVVLALVGCDTGNVFKRYASEIFRPEITTTMGAESNSSQLDAKISGKGVTQYKYKMGSQASTDCGVAAGYGVAYPVSMPISEAVPPVDGGYRLCVYGGSADYWSPSYAYATKFDWIRDTVPPSLADIVFPKPYINTDLNISIAGSERVNYRYKVTAMVTGDEQCPDLGSNHSASEPLVEVLADGRYLLCLSASDLAGNESEVASRIFIKDSVLPKIALNALAKAYRTSTKVMLKWTFAEEHPSAEMLLEQSLDNGKTYQPVKSLAPSVNTFEWTAPSSEKAGIKLRLTHIDLAGNIGQAESQEIRTDDTGPTVTFYLGSEPTDDACIHPPITHDQAATHLVPYDYCIKDGGAAPSGISDVCVKSSGGAPSETDTCWIALADVTKLTLLANGPNTVKAYARDQAGNIGASAAKTITLNIGTPPTLDILSPSGTQVAASVWNAGEKKTITWKSIDDNTPFSDLKFIVTLVEAADATKFKHLACSFANTPVWRQCPETSIQNSPLITLNGSANTASFAFTVPDDWNSAKKYLLVVSSIDKSGNAAIASTQELNAGFEVLAGRTYKGLGGTGITMGRSPVDAFLIVDKRGQLLDTTNNLKINAFDYRTCRMTRPLGGADTMNDCPDILELPGGAYILNHPWAYNPDKDVFYAHSGGTPTVADPNPYNNIVELDFNHKKAEYILGEITKPVFTDQIPAATLAKAFSSRSLMMYMFYDTVSKRLLLRQQAQLFSIDATYHLQYVMGTRGGTAVPVDQSGISQKDILLPNWDRPFAITKDRRLLVGGDKLPSDPFGSGCGRHYIVEAISLGLPTNVARLFSFSLVPGGTANESRDLRGLAYDSIKERFFGSLAWNGLFEMKLPPKGSAPDTYKWTAHLLYVSGNENPERLVLNQDQTQGVPYTFNIFSGGGLAYAGEDLLYIQNRQSGTVLSLNLRQNRLENVIGHILGDDAEGFGQNQYLATPRYMAIDKNGDLLFNDYYSLQRLSVGSMGSGNPEASTLSSALRQNYFKYDTSTDRLHMLRTPRNVASARLSSYDMSDLKTPISQIPISGFPYQYDLQFGISNDLQQPKAAIMSSIWDSGLGAVKYQWFATFDFTALVSGRAIGHLLTVSDQYALATDYCGTPSGPCNQGTKINDNYYAGSTFRIIKSSAYYFSQDLISTVAFDANNEDVYSCANNLFTKFVAATKRVYQFSVVTSTGAALSCATLASHFLSFDDKLYFSKGQGGSAVYQMDTSKIESHNTAIATMVPTVKPMLPGNYGGIYLTQDHIYYTDMTSHRVVRSRRQ